MSNSKNARISLVLWTLLCTICMAGMLWFTATKQIVIADVGGSEREKVNVDSSRDENMEPLYFAQDITDSNRLDIPLEAGTKADKVMVDNRYMDKELWIYIKDASEDFYQKSLIGGNTAAILNGYYEQQGEYTILKIQLTDVFEYRSILEEGHLYVEFYAPWELYDQIVVIDPAFGGEQSGVTEGGYAEKDLNLEIAMRVRNALEQYDIKAYYTRLEDKEVSLMDRASIANEVNADMFISIGGAGVNEDQEMYGTTCFYNSHYYIPDFGSVDLADILEYHVVSAASGRALGLVEAEDDSILSLLKVPAAQLSVGYLTNTQERTLLKDPAYLDKIAEGIVSAILEAFAQIAETEQ